MQGLNDDEFEALLSKVESKLRSQKNDSVSVPADPRVINFHQVPSPSVTKDSGNGNKAVYVEESKKPSKGSPRKSIAAQAEPEKRQSRRISEPVVVSIAPASKTPRATQSDDRLDAIIQELSEVILPPTEQRIYTSHPSLSERAIAHNDLADMINNETASPKKAMKSTYGRCGVVKVGGTRYSRGFNASVGGYIACDKLICIACDHRVLQIQDSVWTGLVDYLFLRNNYPSLSKLSTHLKREIGAVAYCCQCAWLSAEIIEDVSKIKWRCAAH